MDKWEYMTKFVLADIDAPGAAQFLQRKWPEWAPAQFSPQTMIPELNEWGAAGWELLHMQPVADIGRNDDILFAGAEGHRWSNKYFCVFKRRIPE